MQMVQLFLEKEGSAIVHGPGGSVQQNRGQIWNYHSFGKASELEEMWSAEMGAACMYINQAYDGPMRDVSVLHLYMHIGRFLPQI
jgi:hypothetical protein